ncbi:MAG: sulfotransferase [Nitrospirae bacterium]|nr:MAG: sulfotransferase [Nitrospirota bacterium]
MLNTLIVLTGHRKSGTSMFHRLFDGHPELIIYPDDISLLYAYFPCYAYQPDATPAQLRDRIRVVVKKSLSEVYESEEDSRFVDGDGFSDLLLKNLSGRDIRKKGDLINAVAEAWCSYKKITDTEKPFLFKETSQSIFFQELKLNFPRLKMIALLRDPRDNYAALKAGVKEHYSKMGEGELETLASLLNRARMDFLSAEVNLKQFPKDFMAVKFEDLIVSPLEVMKNVCEFIGIQFTESLLIPTLVGREYKGNSYDKKKFSGISGENLGKWHERISGHEAMIIEYWLGDVMDQWGYPKAFSSVESQKAFSEFYNWYNCKYFFSDNFK